MILHTNGIEYDDRIRKEILTVMKLHPDIKFKIFAILDNKMDEHGEFVSDYGVEYYVPLLKSRLKYKQGTHIYRKAWDFYKTVNPLLKDFDAIWCADIDPVFFIAMSHKRKVWDLHEIPQIFLKNRLTKCVLKYLMSKCKVIVHANAQRIRYIDEVGALSNKNSQCVIRNYPSFNDEDGYTDETFDRFKKWLGQDKCVYLQGATGPKRCDLESILGIMAIPNLKVVVVGLFDEKLKSKLKKQFGDDFEKRVFFTGLVRQQMTPHYIKACNASLVLYREDRANNKYCEPNRMFQSIINECPVVVGCNPPMKDLVEQHNYGIALPTDGSNVDDISKGLEKVLSNHDTIVESIKKNRHNILWDSQDEEFKRIIDKLFA